MFTHFEVKITARAREKPYVHSWADLLIKDFNGQVVNRILLDREGNFVLLEIEAKLPISMEQFAEFRHQINECFANGRSYTYERPFYGQETMTAKMVAVIETWSILPQQPMDPQFVWGLDSE